MIKRSSESFRLFVSCLKSSHNSKWRSTIRIVCGLFTMKSSKTAYKQMKRALELLQQKNGRRISVLHSLESKLNTEQKVYDEVAYNADGLIQVIDRVYPKQMWQWFSYMRTLRRWNGICVHQRKHFFKFYSCDWNRFEKYQFILDYISLVYSTSNSTFLKTS